MSLPDFIDRNVAQRALTDERIKPNIQHRRCWIPGWFCRVLFIYGPHIACSTVSQTSVQKHCSAEVMGVLRDSHQHRHILGFSSKEIFLSILKNCGVGCFWRRPSAIVLNHFLLGYCLETVSQGVNQLIRIILVFSTKTDFGVPPDLLHCSLGRKGEVGRGGTL